VAVIGASDREGNLGGLAVGFLRKFGYPGPIWPVNAGRDVVGGLPCFPGLAALPSVPDQAIIAVPAESVVSVVRDCLAAHVPAAVVWAGGFAETDAEGRARQRELEDVCRGTGLKLCGPNCIGVINTALGLTASFSSLMSEVDQFIPGAVSMVSQSGGTAVTTHARAQELGFGFRVTVSCGNEAVLGIPDFVRALAQDVGTRVIAVYTEGLSDPAGFVEALAAARRAGKPVVASLGAVAASGGYYIAVAADQIYANPGTLTGSIGVIMQMANFEQLMKKVGVDYVVVKAGQFKDLGNPGRPMTPDERRVLQTLLDDVHGQFIGAVASGRKLEREDVVRFADGRVFSGQQAKDLKMVDALGGLEDAVLAAGKLAGLPTPPAVIPPKRKFSFMDLLRNQFGGSAAAALLRPSLPAFKTPLYLMD
jgi:signal peptide peptidase SppA